MGTRVDSMRASSFPFWASFFKQHHEWRLWHSDQRRQTGRVCGRFMHLPGLLRNAVAWANLLLRSAVPQMIHLAISGEGEFYSSRTAEKSSSPCSLRSRSCKMENLFHQVIFAEIDSLRYTTVNWTEKLEQAWMFQARLSGLGAGKWRPWANGIPL